MIQLDRYTSNKWSNKLQIKKSGKAYFDDEVEKSRSEGVLLHQILSEIIHYQDTNEVLEKYEKAMLITSGDRIRYETLFGNLWRNDQVKAWFSGVGEIKTEVVVLPKDGDVKRMDRVIVQENQATVLDFKNGRPKSEDKKQLTEYVALLTEMGYKTTGYLLYLRSGEVVSLVKTAT